MENGAFCQRKNVAMADFDNGFISYVAKISFPRFPLYYASKTLYGNGTDIILFHQFTRPKLKNVCNNTLAARLHFSINFCINQ